MNKAVETADSAPGATTLGDTLSARSLRVAIRGCEHDVIRKIRKTACHR